MTKEEIKMDKKVTYMGKYQSKRRYMENFFTEYQTGEYDTKEQCYLELLKIADNAERNKEDYELGKFFIVTITREKNEVDVNHE